MYNFLYINHPEVLFYKLKKIHKCILIFPPFLHIKIMYSVRYRSNFIPVQKDYNKENRFVASYVWILYKRCPPLQMGTVGVILTFYSRISGNFFCPVIQMETIAPGAP